MITSPWLNIQPYAVLQSYLVAVASGAVASSAGELDGSVVAPKVLLVGSDTDIVVRGLRWAYSGDYVDDAVLAASIVTYEGTALVSGVSVPYVAGSSGEYMGTFTSAQMAAIADRTHYLLVLSGGTDNASIDWRIRKRAVYRGNVRC